MVAAIHCVPLHFSRAALLLFDEWPRLDGTIAKAARGLKQTRPANPMI
jgi:hypothetical protein